MPGKRGWPKGKKRGPLSEPHKKKLRAGRVRSNHRKRVRDAEISSGFNLGSGLNNTHSESQVLVETTRAVWFPKEHHIGDCEYVDGDLDEVFMRALHDRVVYAGSACCHHETALQEITIDVIAAVDREARRNGRTIRRGLPKPLRPEGPPVKIRKITPAVVLPAVVPRSERPPIMGMTERRAAIAKLRKMTAARPIEREGKPLTAVVEELFAREGKPLLEVVSELLKP